jgi:hypothetical protein
VSQPFASVVTGVVFSFAVATSLFAQGKSTDPHGNGKDSGTNVPGASGTGAGNSGKTSNAGGNGGGRGAVSPPSEVALAAPTSIAMSASASTPFAWIDNANLMAPGAVWVGVSTVRWQNAGVNEISFPVIDAAIGMTPRLQIGASVPRLAASEALGRPSGLGTTFLNAKIGILTDSARPIKAAVTPTVEILGDLAMQFAPAGQGRVQWGLPVSLELDRGVGRVYGSAGYFSPDIWYTGAGAGAQFGSRLGLSVSFSRSWAGSVVADPSLPPPYRHELSTGVSLDVTRNIGVFGSVGRTFKTDAQFGAGTTASVGVSLTTHRSAFTQ